MNREKNKLIVVCINCKDKGYTEEESGEFEGSMFIDPCPYCLVGNKYKEIN